MSDRGHPKGLYLLFTVEMWERLSYYGMRALLVLYMVSKTTDANPGFGMTKGDALQVYGWYTGLVYATPMIGGWLADNMIGQRRAVYIGGIFMMIGHFLMALPGLPIFFTALTFLIIGNGFFKPNISTMVGGLYEEGDPRRDSAFTIFYMGINLGAFLSGIVCGTLGEKIGYHWGFASAGVGMLIGLLSFWAGEKKLIPAHIGQKPVKASASGGDVKPKEPLTRKEIDRIVVILVLAIFVMFFWAAFEQAGGLMNIYTKEKVNRVVMGFEVPASWFQSINPAIIFVFAPIFSALWAFLGRRNIDPPTPIKMAFGLILLSFGFILMLLAVNEADGGSSGLAAFYWVFGAYFWHTMGELCLSPIGLSMVTKLAPARMVSLMMGIWFGSNFVANIAAAYIGKYSEKLGEFHLFFGIVVGTAAAGMILFLVSRPLVRMMHLEGEGKNWGWMPIVGMTGLCALLYFGYPMFLEGQRNEPAFVCTWDQREAKANLHKIEDLQEAYFSGNVAAPDQTPKARGQYGTLAEIGFFPVADRVDFTQLQAQQSLKAIKDAQLARKKAGQGFVETVADLKLSLEGPYTFTVTSTTGGFFARATRNGEKAGIDGRDLSGDVWVMDHAGTLSSQTSILYDYKMTKLDPKSGFTVEARRRSKGNPKLVNDVWTIDQAGKLTNVSGGCQ